MKSIRNKIQNALIGAIVAVVVCSIVILAVNQLGAFKNQKIIELMTTEYSVINLTDDLILKYNDAVKSPENVEILNIYREKEKKINSVLATLDQQIVSEESKFALLGLKNTVKKVVDECNRGLKEAEENNFLNLSDHFVAANTNNDFVRDNTRTLLQKELEYLYKNQENSKRVYKMGIVFSLGIFLMIVMGMTLYATRFSKQLTSPLTKLSVFAKEVASGGLDDAVEPDLYNRSDEIGDLASSFSYMIKTIRTKIEELNLANEQLLSSTDALKKGNLELEKMNSFMVSRELKMVELKKKIAELTKNG